nr:uncharacterized protein LOC128688526 [Cherax quadricarinatus]
MTTSPCMAISPVMTPDVATADVDTPDVATADVAAPDVATSHVATPVVPSSAVASTSTAADASASDIVSKSVHAVSSATCKFGSLISTWSESENPECADIYQKFITLYEIHDRYSGKISLPAPFAKKVSEWSKGDKNFVKNIHHQHLIHVFHPLTSEHVVYNPVRAKRPMPIPEMNIFEWVDKTSAETAKDCDFCQYDNMTAVDEFGRYVLQVQYIPIFQHTCFLGFAILSIFLDQQRSHNNSTTHISPTMVCWKLKLKIINEVQ